MGALWTYFFVFILYNNAVKKLLRPPPPTFCLFKKMESELFVGGYWAKKWLS